MKMRLIQTKHKIFYVPDPWGNLQAFNVEEILDSVNVEYSNSYKYNNGYGLVKSRLFRDKLGNPYYEKIPVDYHGSIYFIGPYNSFWYEPSKHKRYIKNNRPFKFI